MFTGAFTIPTADPTVFDAITVVNADKLIDVKLIQTGNLGDNYITGVKAAGFTSAYKLRVSGEVSLTASAIVIQYTKTT